MRCSDQFETERFSVLLTYTVAVTVFVTCSVQYLVGLVDIESSLYVCRRIIFISCVIYRAIAYVSDAAVAHLNDIFHVCAVIDGMSDDFICQQFIQHVISQILEAPCIKLSHFNTLSTCQIIVLSLFK